MLTDLQCRNAKARAQDYKLPDEKGLYLFVTKAGFKSWRMKYRVTVMEDGAPARKEKRLTFGPYPEVSMAEARDQRDEARKLLRAGIDPAVHRKQQKAKRATEAGQDFASQARAWIADQASTWSPRYAKKTLEALERDIFPSLGSMPIRAITVPLVLQALRAVEARPAIETAHRLRQNMSEIFLRAIGEGLADADPAHVVKSALLPVPKGRRPAHRKVVQARASLLIIETAPAYPVTLLASRLLALTAARPGVVQLAEPFEFEDLDGPNPRWHVAAAKMKLTRQKKLDADFDFVMPLSRQSVEVVKAALRLVGPRATYLFPSVRSIRRPLSNNTLSKHYREAGLRGKLVPHGWRSTFSTVMNELAATERRKGDREIIDLMLAHIADGVEAIYNRAAYMPRRRELAQEWADLLMEDAPPAESLLPEY